MDADLKRAYYVVNFIDKVDMRAEFRRRGFEIVQLNFVPTMDGSHVLESHELKFEVLLNKWMIDDIKEEMRMCAGMISQMVEGKSEHTIDSIRAYYLL